MPELKFQAQIGASWGELDVDIRDLVVMASPQGPAVLAITGPGGGMMSLRFANGQLQQFDTVNFPDAMRGEITGFSAMLGAGNDSFVILGDTDAGEALGYALNAQGGIDAGSASDLPIYVGDSGPVVATSAQGFIYTTTDHGRVQGFSAQSDGYRAIADFRDTERTYAADPVALDMVEIEGAEYLVTLSASDVGLSSFLINPQTGALSHAAAVGTATGLGLLANPTDMQIVTTQGGTFAVVSSAARTSEGGALTVVQIGADGSMQVADHILDSRDTRFGSAHTVEVAQVGDWTYVVAGGGDAGLSLFTLTPAGRLVHLNTMEDTNSAGLETIEAITMLLEGNELHVFAASQASHGLAHLTVDVSAQGLVLEAASGTLVGQGQDDLLIGGAGDNALFGNDGDDILIDGYGTDALTGGAGADTFVFGADGQSDSIRDFEYGVDRIDLSAVPMLYSSNQLSVGSHNWGARLMLPGGEILDIRSADGRSLSADQIFASIDWETDRPPLVLRNEVIGSEAHDQLEGGNGTDVMEGRGGNDTLLGRPGSDMLDGGNGNDVLEGGDGADVLKGGRGADILDGQGGDDRLEGGNWHDILSGGSGDDQLLGGGGHDRLMGGEGNDTLEGQYGFDTLEGGAGNDWMHGGGLRDVLFGGAGDDTLDGAFGHDRLEGGEGHDSLFGGNNNDTLRGGEGNDTLEGHFGVDVIDGGLGNDWIHGGSMPDVIRGGSGNDTVNGGAGADRIWLEDGNDVFRGFFQWGNFGRDAIWGGGGNDTISASAGHDTVHGDEGNDLVSGGLGADQVFGGTGRDTVIGGGGNDRLYGGEGNDRLEGQRGADIMTGGEGSDVFVFKEGGGRDVLTDFEVNIDYLLFITADDNSFGDLRLVDAPRGLWVEWSSGSVLLEGREASDLDHGDVLFG